MTDTTQSRQHAVTPARRRRPADQPTAATHDRGHELFLSIDKPALKALPAERYSYAEWKRCTVAPDNLASM